MSTEHGVALITGAGRGLGRAFAIALAECGFTVALTARTEAEINATAEAIVHNGGRAIAVPGDVTDRQAVERAVATTEAELGSIYLLINNVCAMISQQSFRSSGLAFPSAKATEAPREHTTLKAVALFSPQVLSILSPSDACDTGQCAGGPSSSPDSHRRPPSA